MHVGVGRDRRDTPAPVRTYEVHPNADDYQQSRVWYTEDAFKRVTDARDRLLSDSGLLQPVGDRGASFFHFSFQEFLSAERLADLDKERIVDIFREHGGTPEWRNTLSFLFGAQLSNNVGPQRAVEVLLGVLDQVVETMSPVRALLAADCIEVLRGRQVSLEEEPLRRMREACLHGMRGERPAAERCQLGDALGRIGDHRFRHNVFWLPNDDLLGFVEVDGSIPCYIGRFPVTVAQFRVFVDDRGSNGGFMLRDPAALRGLANHPVVRIAPDEGKADRRWLTIKLRSDPHLRGRLAVPDSWQARLPTEGEWRSAAAADSRRFPWGWETHPNRFNGDRTGIGGTSSVGCFPGGRTSVGIEELSGRSGMDSQSGTAGRTSAVGPSRPSD